MRGSSHAAILIPSFHALLYVQPWDHDFYFVDYKYKKKWLADSESASKTNKKFGNQFCQGKINNLPLHNKD